MNLLLSRHHTDPGAQEAWAGALALVGQGAVLGAVEVEILKVVGEHWSSLHGVVVGGGVRAGGRIELAIIVLHRDEGGDHGDSPWDKCQAKEHHHHINYLWNGRSIPVSMSIL